MREEIDELRSIVNVMRPRTFSFLSCYVVHELMVQK
jgi:hypothetical protein